MKLKMCAVYDSKAMAYMPPQFFRTIGEAERTFTDACNREDSNFAKHAEDYSFHHIGDYDDGTAEALTEKPRLIMSAQQAVQQQTEKQFQLNKEQDGMFDLGKKLQATHPRESI